MPARLSCVLCNFDETGFSPEYLVTRSPVKYNDVKDFLEMNRDDQIAERTAIESYGEMLNILSNDDPITT